MAERSYPADPAETGFVLFQRWLGAHYARATSITSFESVEGVLRGSISVGRRWDLSVTLLDTLATDTSFEWEATRAAIEERLDLDGRAVALWVPRDASLPAGEPGISQIVAAVEHANTLEDGRLEVRRPVALYLRRTGTEGSVLTILGGLQPHWAKFTNRVPGSFQLQARDLVRLPFSEEEREDLVDRIVLAAGQPEADETQVIPATDVWTANELGAGNRSCILGTPKPEDDDWSASLRRNLRKLLRQAAPGLTEGQPAARALVVLGASTYAAEEKLSWALRGMDPGLYAGYHLITVIADGLVKPLLLPGRSALPWDVQFG
ncbi:MAG: hypothetical protein LC118_07560 [Dehalococcoidia bacterium]|nr:hypothetical protein [Dehalococcoidia bacterium]